MKLAAGDVDAFLRKPWPQIRAVLLYGPDAGLVAERAKLLTRAVLDGADDDPFRLVVLDNDAVAKDSSRLADEAAQLCLMGGRRVVRLREPADTIAKQLTAVLATPAAEALIVVEGGDLARVSALRKLAESDAAAVAIPCYEDGPRELAQLLRETLRAHRIALADDAAVYLTDNLGGDRMLSRQEIEKLVLFAGEGGTITLADAAALVGNSSALELDDVIYIAFDQDWSSISAGLDRLFLAGEAPVTVLRAAQRHAQRLHLALARVRKGEPAEAVLQSQRLFFRNAHRFRAQMERWRLAQLNAVLRQLTAAELDCKSTGYPDQTVCRQTLMLLGRLPART